MTTLFCWGRGYLSVPKQKVMIKSSSLRNSLNIPADAS